MVTHSSILPCISYIVSNRNQMFICINTLTFYISCAPKINDTYKLFYLNKHALARRFVSLRKSCKYIIIFFIHFEQVFIICGPEGFFGSVVYMYMILRWHNKPQVGISRLKLDTRFGKCQIQLSAALKFFKIGKNMIQTFVLFESIHAIGCQPASRLEIIDKKNLIE